MFEYLLVDMLYVLVSRINECLQHIISWFSGFPLPDGFIKYLLYFYMRCIAFPGKRRNQIVNTSNPKNDLDDRILDSGFVN